MKLLQRWKQTALHHKALVATSVLVAFGTLFYAVAAVFQVWLMKESAKQAAEQTDKLINAANGIDRSFKDALRQNRDSLNETLSQNQKALDATLAQGQKALNTAICEVQSIDFDHV